jgi:hypothetical protein
MVEPGRCCVEVLRSPLAPELAPYRAEQAPVPRGQPGCHPFPSGKSLRFGRCSMLSMLPGRFFHMMGGLKVVFMRPVRVLARAEHFSRPVVFGRLLMMLDCWMNRHRCFSRYTVQTCVH